MVDLGDVGFVSVRFRLHITLDEADVIRGEMETLERGRAEIGACAQFIRYVYLLSILKAKPCNVNKLQSNISRPNISFNQS